MGRLVRLPLTNSLPADYPNSEPRPLLDRADRIFTALVGQPKEEAYASSAQRFHNEILKEGRVAKFEPEERRHRRGNFPALNTGITHRYARQGVAYPHEPKQRQAHADDAEAAG